MKFAQPQVKKTRFRRKLIPPVISKKICLLGTVCVGKTSLVRRFVHSKFSDQYHSTIGVKIDKKTLQVDRTPVTLLVWDVQGEDRYAKVLNSYLKGLSGYLLVIDVTNPLSADVAVALHKRVNSEFGEIPFILAYNKCDLPEHLETHSRATELHEFASKVIYTSALSGEGVEEAFQTLAAAIVPLKKAG